VFGGYTLYGITFLVQLTLDVLVYYNKLSMTEQTFLLSPKFGTQYLSDHEIRTVLHGATTENCSSKIKLDSSEQQAHKSKAVSFFFFFSLTVPMKQLNVLKQVQCSSVSGLPVQRCGPAL